jgi:hypothetical protein
MSSGTPGQPGEEETDESKGRKGLLPYLSSWSAPSILNFHKPSSLAVLVSRTQFL